MPEPCDHNCDGCGVADCGDRAAGMPAKAEPNAHSSIKSIIAIVSGKGGVGKSLVTSLLATEMTRRGLKVGILDADVTGPSIPKSFGVPSNQLTVTDDAINPPATPSGIKVMSVNLMLPQEDVPVAWRGPIVTGVIMQFFQEVNWGDLDYLLVDMPPGTSDVFLTVFQMIPVDAVVTVSAPQELVSVIVGKAVNLACSMNAPVIGIVENMASYTCDHCGTVHHIFGKPQGKAVAERYGIPATAELPIDPELAHLVDTGRVETYEKTEPLASIVDAILEQTRPAAEDDKA